MEKKYDLENRTKEFAKNIRLFVKILPKTRGNFEDISQLVRSSGSIGANYIEANESLSQKDFVMRVKISRKEAKESAYWLDLIDTEDKKEIEIQRQSLLKEAKELILIMSAIMRKSL
jgi:four helix bundle protein